MLFLTYFLEIYLFLLYFSVSLILSAFILIYHVHSLIFLEIFYFIKFYNQVFLSTLSTDLLNCFYILIFYDTFLLNLIYFSYVLNLSVKSSLYFFQVSLLKIFSLLLLICGFLLFLFFNLGFIPSLFSLLFNWEFLTLLKLSVLIKLELNLVTFIFQLILLRSFFFFLFSFFFFLFSFFFFLFSFFQKVQIFKLRRIWIFFVSTLFLLCFNFNFFFQFTILFIFLFFFEFVFFWICLKNLINLVNANFNSVTKIS
nr:Sec-independent protein translocase component TatC [Ceramothamnion sp.]